MEFSKSEENVAEFHESERNVIEFTKMKKTLWNFPKVKKTEVLEKAGTGYQRFILSCVTYSNDFFFSRVIGTGLFTVNIECKCTLKLCKGYKLT